MINAVPAIRNLICASFLFVVTLNADAGSGDKPPVEVDAFGSVMVLENGRKMPMDSFARIKLLQYSGKSTLHRQPALIWLCRALFTPEAAADDKIFVINHPQVLQSLGLEPEARRRYSLSQIQPARQTLFDLARAASAMEDDARTIVEDELLRVAHNVNTCLSLMESFQFAIPDEALALRSPALRERLGLTDAAPLLSIWRLAMQIHLLEDVGKADDESDERYDALRLAGLLNRAATHYQNRPPPMIPVTVEGAEHWVSPSSLVRAAVNDEQVQRFLAPLAEMVEAYRAGEQTQFDSAAMAFCERVQARAVPDRQTKHVALELSYNRLDLFYRCELLYGLAFLLAFAALINGSRRVRWAGLACLLAGLALHTAAIALRMTIMGRPPVTNLYSTFIFVAWAAVLLCVIMELVQKHVLGLLAGGLSGLALLLLSRRFMSMSDPMGVLVAVLDSNFWLATHVVTISLGYAGCCLAGVIGHFYLLQAIIKPGDRERLRACYTALFAVLGFGFTFSFLGTMLGGVWADQSWGRFWGWDPKENGALLIVLWCAILFHARLSRMIGSVGMAAGTVLGIIIVLFAWVGVNLLGVGLHSYGFTSGVGGGLFAYSGIQMVVLVGLVVVAKRRLRSVGKGVEGDR